MNNKRLGTAFEREVCRTLSDAGYWVHFLSPDERGAQPFDIIAVRYGVAFAIDCKTSVKPVFPLSRLEENQIFAFDKWIACGNLEPYIFVKYEGQIYMLPYWTLRDEKRVDVRECKIWGGDIK